MKKNLTKKSRKPEKTNVGREFRAGIHKERNSTDLETEVLQKFLKTEPIF